MPDWKYAASPDAVVEMLEGGGEFVVPPSILNDLTEAQASVIVPASPHSIAQIVAHMHFYQNATLAKAQRQTWPKPAHLEDTFAPPAPGEWPALRADFLAGIEACKALAKTNGEAISPDREDTSLCYDLTESALHNAYHLGQIVLLRQMQALWPPQDGDNNDF